MTGGDEPDGSVMYDLTEQAGGELLIGIDCSTPERSRYVRIDINGQTLMLGREAARKFATLLMELREQLLEKQPPGGSA